MKRLVEAGLTWLRTNQQTVNALNVFPVPDGDTGTNMVLTMQSAWNEIKDLGHRSLDVHRLRTILAKPPELQVPRMSLKPNASALG